MKFGSNKFNREHIKNSLKKLRFEHVSKMDEQRKKHVKAKILMAIENLETEPSKPEVYSVNSFFMRLRYSYVVPIVLFLFITTSVFAAASNAKPGDALYPIKKVSQTVALHLAVTDNQKAKIQVSIAQDLVDNYKQLQQQENTDSPKSIDEQQHQKNNIAAAQTELNNSLSNLVEEYASQQAKGNKESANLLAGAINNIKTETKVGCTTDGINCGTSTMAQHTSGDSSSTTTNKNTATGSTQNNATSTTNNTGSDKQSDTIKSGTSATTNPTKDLATNNTGSKTVQPTTPVKDGSNEVKSNAQNVSTIRTVAPDLNGQTITLKVGDKLLFKLGSGTWTFKFDGGGMLSAVPLTSFQGAQAVYNASQAGSIVVTVTNKSAGKTVIYSFTIKITK